MSKRRVLDPQVARHRALSESARVALLGVLEGSSRPLDAHVLAEQIGLHVNTVRWHLGVLVDAGLVVEARAVTGAPGRPRHAYRLAEVSVEIGAGTGCWRRFSSMR